MDVDIRPHLYALRAQLDATLLLVEMQHGLMPQQVTMDPATTCPECGSTGDSQVDKSTLDGTRRILCVNCRRERELPRVA